MLKYTDYILQVGLVELLTDIHLLDIYIYRVCVWVMLGQKLGHYVSINTAIYVPLIIELWPFNRFIYNNVTYICMNVVLQHPDPQSYMHSKSYLSIFDSRKEKSTNTEQGKQS